MIGKTISHYRIVEKIGEGGMGVVYLAEDTLLGRHVAIKTLTIKPGQDSQHFRTRFLREARAVSALSHPNIATIHDYGELNGEPYIVMEFVRGETLGGLMLTESLTIPQTLDVIAQVADALAEAHRNGVVHRDIKPSNVAINHRGEVKVLDFGLAKQLNVESLSSTDAERQTLLTSQTQDGVILGTPLYLSPEQALGTDIDARSDIFSLGTLLYECVAGKPPFDGAGKMEICTKVIRDDPVLPSKLNANVPAEIDRIVMKALAKKPDDRYQTAESIADDLRAARAQIGATAASAAVPRLAHSVARPTGALATLSDIFRRPRISVGYVIAGIVLVVLASVVVWRMTRTKPYEPAPEAKRLYELAVNALREGEFFKSSKLLQQAVTTDDRFALAHARLAEAWTELDLSDKAKDELIRAGDLVPNRAALDDADALRLEGITNTVRRDFGAAVENYRQLTNRVPASEKRFALVDLGRAYEKNEQLDRAIESYQQASREDPNYAAAFLRLGVALARQQNYAEALTALDRAEQVFGLSNEVEGMTEVLFQRGIVLLNQGKLTEAQTEFTKALERSTALENNEQRIRTLQQLSYAFIQTGDTAKSRQYSEQATALARENGMENLTVAGLIDIGTAYLLKGDFTTAEKNYSEALRLAQLYKAKFNEARAMLALGGLRKQREDPHGAVDYLQRALTFFQQGGYGRQTLIAQFNLGYVYLELGNYPAAEQTFQQLLNSAQKVGDQRQVGFARDGLGYVYLQTERFPEAFAQFAEEYKIEKEIKAQLTMGFAANYCASALWKLGKYEDASTSLREALTIAQPVGQETYDELLADASQNAAGLSLSQRNFKEAVTQARKGAELAGARYKSIAVDAKSTLALALALSGQPIAGRAVCLEAIDIARGLSNPYSLSTASLALAQVALMAGDAQTAATNGASAQQAFAQANQHESEWRACAIQALAADKLGDKPKARQLASLAENILAGLEKTWGAESFKSYLGRPDIKEIRSQLDLISR